MAAPALLDRAAWPSPRREGAWLWCTLTLDRDIHSPPGALDWIRAAAVDSHLTTDSLWQHLGRTRHMAMQVSNVNSLWRSGVAKLHLTENIASVLGCCRLCHLGMA